MSDLRRAIADIRRLLKEWADDLIFGFDCRNKIETILDELE